MTCVTCDLSLSGFQVGVYFKNVDLLAKGQGLAMVLLSAGCLSAWLKSFLTRTKLSCGVTVSHGP